MSLREKAKTLNSLVCLLQGLVGKKTTIGLRHETNIYGLILSVDVYMNTHMKSVKFTALDGTTTYFDHLYVKGLNIRFVHIPDDINIIETIEKQLYHPSHLQKSSKKTAIYNTPKPFAKSTSKLKKERFRQLRRAQELDPLHSNKGTSIPVSMIYETKESPSSDSETN